MTSVSVQFYQSCMQDSDTKVQEFIEHHQEECSNWNLGLTGACKANNKDVQHMMVVFGANYCGNCSKTAVEHIQQ